jgi:phosphoenolpyruvate-protein phosphotransferase (PTS system enzyme I)
VPASPGTGLARALIHRPDEVHLPDDEVDDLEAEGRRLAEAMEWVANELDEVAGRAEGELADVLEAQAMMARDPELLSSAQTIVTEDRAGAARAVVEAGEEYAQALAGSESEYMAARAEDIRDVCARIARRLVGAAGNKLREVDEPVVIAATELPPADVAELDPESIIGIATERGSRTSHTAIVARALRIPAVVGVDGLLEAVADDVRVAVEGDEGRVYVDPDEETSRRVEAKATERERNRKKLEARVKDGPLRTKDGHRVELAANVGAAVELQAALDEGAEAVGLLRTELLYLERSEPPEEDEQAAMLTGMTEQLGDRRLVMRTFDFGADKPVPFLSVEREDNPALGVRGIRLARKHEDLLDTQVRAAVRAAQAGGKVAIMAPMVSTLEEADWLVERVAEAGGSEADIEVGVMIEVPSAVLLAGELADRLDFLSIGTNDLTQYLHAADRQSGSLAYLQDPFAPALVRAVKAVCNAAQGRAWVGVCGEAAGDPAWAMMVTGLGVAELSMGADRLLEVRVVIQSATLEDCRNAARVALEATDPGSARKAVQEVMASL